MRSVWVAAVVFGLAMEAAGARASTDPFTAPTPEELAMKELPGYPGVAAVVLYREEVWIDDAFAVQHYARIKILTEEGKKYANVELPYYKDESEFGVEKNIGEIDARTIHVDGKIIPFTGKPYIKTLESDKSATYQAKVFTLPDVEVGSIIEYRYQTRYQTAYVAPTWSVQGSLFVKSAHYGWFPTIEPLEDSKERDVKSISSTCLLPPGAKVEKGMDFNPGLNARVAGGKKTVYTLDVKDVPPVVEEEFGPPIGEYRYRVMFSFTPYKTRDEYWRSEGKEWSKRLNSFAEPNGALKSKTEEITAGAATQDEKLRKIYAAVMGLENTQFTRERDAREDKAEGEKIKSVADILKLGRGSPYQLTELFIGMARAAGMKAYGMLVPDRSIEVFWPGWLSFEQFDGLLAIVNVDGKERCFDPGWRYEPYGHLAWQHTLVTGLRQSENGTEFNNTRSDSYKANVTTRAANFVLDEKGGATGLIQITYTGTAAVQWRHTVLSGDDESLRHALEKSMENKLPKSLDVKVKDVKNLTDYEQPLVVSYSVTGTLGTVTGKRLLLLADPLLARVPATFPHEKREQPVYFQYPEMMEDALRVIFKKGFTLEALPAADKQQYKDVEGYDFSVSSDATSFTTRRTHVQEETLVYPQDYASLRQFYSGFESKDKESVVLKMAPTETAATPE